jgi:hypothetical protein
MAPVDKSVAKLKHQMEENKFHPFRLQIDGSKYRVAPLKPSFKADCKKLCFLASDRPTFRISDLVDLFNRSR